MNKKTIKDVDVAGKQVLMRVDFNVPINEDGTVGDQTRINAALPTIQHVLDAGASVVLMSHLGRPKGEVKPEFTLAPVAPVLAEKIGRDVKFATDCVGPEVKAMADALQPGEVLLLENLRFHAEEEGKGVEPEAQETFARQLAELGDIFVSDAFGTAHRAHASMAVCTKYFDEKVAGFLLEKEINYLGKALEAPEHPFVAIIGGKKVSDKIQVIENLMGKVDTLLIGGAMAYPFFKAQGHAIGESFCQDDDVPVAAELLKKAEASGVSLVLPTDTLSADDFSAEANIKVAGLGEIEDGWQGLDIGPETAEAYAAAVAGAKTVVWNGPMGCFEMEPFANGTFTVAKALAASDCLSIIGGGDSVSAINLLGIADQMTHISTGGGASLEFLEGKKLPGVEALSDND